MNSRIEELMNYKPYSYITAFDAMITYDTTQSVKLAWTSRTPKIFPE